MQHKNATLNHKIENWSYVDESARTGATGLLAEDVKKIAFQESDDTYWRLTNHSPVTWVQVGSSGGGGGAPSAIISIPYLFDDVQTEGIPAAGYLRGNGSSFEDSTELYLSFDDTDANDWTSFLEGWTNGNANLLIRSVFNAPLFYVFVMNSITFAGGHTKISVAPTAFTGWFSGSLSLDEPILLACLP